MPFKRKKKSEPVVYLGAFRNRCLKRRKVERVDGSRGVIVCMQGKGHTGECD